MLSKVGDRCSGCAACKEICPNSCITMLKDDEGFSYPQIDGESCLKCGLCQRVCPVLSEPSLPEFQTKAFYGWHKDESIRFTSSSGGAFSALADKTLEKGGIVFGAVFDAEKRQVLYGSTRKYKLDDIKRSKYTECSFTGAYEEIKKALESKRQVLCCATPCQAAGIKSYFKDKYDNLTLCDFICSGVASSDCFKAHIESLEKKYGSRAIRVNFRDKDKGWLMMTFTVDFENGKQYKSIASYDMYFTSFANYKLLNRKSCYSCKFSEKHFSDVTIADFWGYAKVPEIKNDDKGISLILINSPKGEEIFNLAKEALFVKPLDLGYTEYAVKKRKLNKERIEDRNKFFAKAKKRGYEKALRGVSLKFKRVPYFIYKIKARQSVK